MYRNYLTFSLEVAEPVDDTRIAIAFATEPILCCLENIIKQKGKKRLNMSADGEPFELDELEVI